jgi:tRNA pseudouridine38-40 synthase
MNRFKLSIEYDGSPYCGFQKQFDIEQKSVAEILENAVFLLTQEKVKIFPSGRTDAGVHALEQVIHFDLEKTFESKKIISGLNNYLRGEAISVLSCEQVDENFHARFGAKMRHYRYVIVNRPAPLAIKANQAFHVSKKLDILAIKEAAKFLLGTHDFSSFRDSQCQANSAIRTITKIEISQNGEEIFIEISAKSFLHHMVRNIVGTLLWAGKGIITAKEVQNILEARDRTKSGSNAPAYGLYFLKTDY